MVINYTALPFVRLENGGLAPGEAVECPHSSAVIRRADAMFRKEANAGAVALARIDSSGLADFEGPLILKTFGDVPEDFECAVCDPTKERIERQQDRSRMIKERREERLPIAAVGGCADAGGVASSTNQSTTLTSAQARIRQFRIPLPAADSNRALLNPRQA